MQATGLCPLTPKPGERGAPARKMAALQKPGPSGGPGNPKLREKLMRDIREVNAQMKYKTGYQTKMQNRP
jgi:hypothetical protein